MEKHYNYGRYSDSISGYISLLKNEKVIRKMRFWDIYNRRRIMKEWTKEVVWLKTDNTYEFLIQYDHDIR